MAWLLRKSRVNRFITSATLNKQMFSSTRGGHVSRTYLCVQSFERFWTNSESTNVVFKSKKKIFINYSFRKGGTSFVNWHWNNTFYTIINKGKIFSFFDLKRYTSQTGNSWSITFFYIFHILTNKINMGKLVFKEQIKNHVKIFFRFVVSIHILWWPLINPPSLFTLTLMTLN